MTRRATHGKLGTSRYVQMTAFYFLVAVSLTEMSQVASARNWVKIWNNIGPDQRLWVACYYVLMWRGYKKPVTLNFGEVFMFKFHEVKLVKTRWWCTFQWENTRQNQTFTVWDHTKVSTMPVACSQCLWEARPDGWYAWDTSQNSFKFFKPWLKPLSAPLDALTDHVHNSLQTFGFSPTEHESDSHHPTVNGSVDIWI